MFKRRRPAIQMKTAEQVELMRAAGLLVGRTLELLRDAVKPGITTLDLDTLAERHIRDNGGVPSFKGYHGFTGTICASINEEIVHGIPRAGKVLRDGDVISIDCGAIVAGWHGDAAITVPVGEVADELRTLLDVTETSLWHGLAAGRAGARLTDMSHAIEAYIRSQGRYGIVEGYGGHGIGTEMHMDPLIPNHGAPGHGPPGAGHVLRGGADGEPRHQGHPGTGRRLDGRDHRREVLGALRAHVRGHPDDGPRVLTALDEGREWFQKLGPATQNGNDSSS